MAKAGTNTSQTARNMVWDQRVAGSNPATPTNLFNDLANPPDSACTGSRPDTIGFPSPVAHTPAKSGRPAKAPRLYLRNDVDGTRSWIIRDHGNDIRTGCKEDDSEAAELAMAAYNQGHQIQTRSDKVVERVYFVTCTTSPNYPIKIGWTSGLDRRMQSMQGGNPNVLTVLATFPGTFRDERALHRRFKHLHIRGEWFRHGDDLSAYIKSLAGYSEAYGMDEFNFSPPHPQSNREDSQ